MERFSVDCPWPPKDLSPNGRLHWAVVARAKRAYRTACGWAATAAGIQRINSAVLHLTITFHPPTNHRRDLDNMIASFKAGADGIVDVCGVDDARWVPEYRIGEVVKNGRVSVVMHPPVDGVIG